MIVCDYCYDEFDTMGELARHIKKNHPEESRSRKPTSSRDGQGGATAIKDTFHVWPTCPLCHQRARWPVYDFTGDVLQCDRCGKLYYYKTGESFQTSLDRDVCGRREWKLENGQLVPAGLVAVPKYSKEN